MSAYEVIGGRVAPGLAAPINTRPELLADGTPRWTWARLDGELWWVERALDDPGPGALLRRIHAREAQELVLGEADGGVSRLPWSSRDMLHHTLHGWRP